MYTTHTLWKWARAILPTFSLCICRHPNSHCCLQIPHCFVIVVVAVKIDVSMTKFRYSGTNTTFEAVSLQPITFYYFRLNVFLGGGNATTAISAFCTSGISIFNFYSPIKIGPSYHLRPLLSPSLTLCRANQVFCWLIYYPWKRWWSRNWCCSKYSQRNVAQYNYWCLILCW